MITEAPSGESIAPVSAFADASTTCCRPTRLYRTTCMLAACWRRASRFSPVGLV
jgi:hypothetical protein